MVDLKKINAGIRKDLDFMEELSAPPPDVLDTPAPLSEDDTESEGVAVKEKRPRKNQKSISGDRKPAAAQSAEERLAQFDEKSTWGTENMEKVQGYLRDVEVELFEDLWDKLRRLKNRPAKSDLIRAMVRVCREDGPAHKAFVEAVVTMTDTKVERQRHQKRASQ